MNQCCQNDGMLAVGIFTVWPTKATGYPGVPLCQECLDYNEMVMYKVRKEN